MSVKEELVSIVDCLPLDATWDDVLYEILVKRKISESLKAVEEGHTISHNDIKKMFAR